MDYDECLSFLFEQLPIFQRQGKAAFNKNLGKTIALCDLLGNPQDHLKFIHVAGTNGKGSVCHMLASVFMEAGYKTGLYTSPHLFDFRERIRINGAFIEKEFVVDFVSSIQEQIKSLKPSFFELTFAMSLAYYKHKACDIVILETGMGGRLDSTNIVQPELSIITTIGLDHQQYLGDTHELIAREKAGIIKPGIPVILGQVQKDAATAIRTVAHSKESPLIDTSAALEDLVRQDNPLNALPGKHQMENLATVHCAFHTLQKAWKLPLQALNNGVSNLQENFEILGRWQVLSKTPKVICDVGHNEDGIKAILNGLEQEEYERLHIIFGMVNDKSTNTINLLPKSASYYLCKANIPRALPEGELSNLFEGQGFEYCTAHNNGLSALQNAISKADKKDLIMVMGSLFIVGEVLQAFETGALTFAS